MIYLLIVPAMFILIILLGSANKHGKEIEHGIHNFWDDVLTIMLFCLTYLCVWYAK